MADALTPPQGLIAVTDRRNIYGLPMGIVTGGGGTKVTTSIPPTYGVGGGMKMSLVGEYIPAVRPPVVSNPLYHRAAGAGQTFRLYLQESMPVNSAGSGQYVRIVTDVVNVRNGAGMYIPSAIL